MGNPKFELYKSTNNGQYYFRLKAENGENIGYSEGYIAKQGALNGIASVKTNASFDSRYTVFEGKDSKYYFNLKAANGEVILSSQGYVTAQGARVGVDSVKSNAPTAPIDDQT